MLVLCMMTRRDWIIAGGFLLLFWTVAGVVVAPRIETRLKQAARVALAQLDEPYGGSRYGNVRIDFEGQQALISGAVRSVGDRNRVWQLVKEELRVPGLGSGLNPVGGLVAESALEVKTLPPGWLLLAAKGGAGEITGVCATESERGVLEDLLRQAWPAFQSSLRFSLRVDSRRFDETPDLMRTIQSLPRPQRVGVASALCRVVRLGELWSEIDLGSGTDTAEEKLIDVGLNDREREKWVSPKLNEMRGYRDEMVRWEAEQKRLQGLPSSHVFLAVRSDLILVRGEMFDLGAKRSLLAGVIAVFPKHRVLDDLRVRGERRPGNEFGALRGLQESRGATLWLGIAGQEWRPLSIEEELEVDEELDGLNDDFLVAKDWLSGGHQGIPVLPIPLKPAYLTLVMHAGQMVLGGQLAEESFRSQVVDAVKKAYPTGWVVRDEITVSGACASSGEIQHTLLSLPPAPCEGEGSVAVVIPGGEWKSRPLSQSLVAENGFLTEAEGWLPIGLDVGMIAASLEEVLSEVRARQRQTDDLLEHQGAAASQ